MDKQIIVPSDLPAGALFLAIGREGDVPTVERFDSVDAYNTWLSEHGEQYGLKHSN